MIARRGFGLAAFALVACSGGDEGTTVTAAHEPPRRVETATITPPRTATAPEETTPATTTAPTATPPSIAPSPDAIARCLWYATREAPPPTGLGSLVDLDARLADAQPDRRARVIGRVRLSARGCPPLSVGLALIARADDDVADDVAFPIDGALPEPVPGARGDERRDAPWDPNAIARGRSSCEDESMPTLVMFRATHARDGAVEAIAFHSLGEPCTVLGHDLEFGDVDGDGSTEVRLRVRTSGLMDMSAGRDRSETLRIVDVATWQVQVELEVATLEDAEVEGYGGRTRVGDVTLRDLDADGDRDLVFTHRDEDRMRSDDDEESFRSSAREAFSYDPTTDVYTRAPTLDPP